MNGSGSTGEFFGGWSSFQNRDGHPLKDSDFFPNKVGYEIGFHGGSNGPWFGSIGGLQEVYERSDL